MSRNGAGTYNLPAGNPVVTGTTISTTWANSTLTDMASALTGSIAADGQTPVTGNIQMSSNKITSLGTPTAAYDATTKTYVDTAITTATGALGTMATQNANNVAITGGTITGLSSALPVASGGTGVTTSTGSGANVLGTGPSISGAVLSSMASSVITSGTSVASTSGTSIDFTSIPSWVKRITVMFNGVSTNSTSNVQVQLGAGSVTTTGYKWIGAFVYSTVGSGTATTGFNIDIGTSGSGTYTRYGLLTITLLGSNNWVSSYTGGNDALGGIFHGGGGSIGLSGALDRVRITTVNGTDTFDAGSINILYE
jgi:hypothetical protein